MRAKVKTGNSHADFICELLEICFALNVYFFLENPDVSWLWSLKPLRRWGLSGLITAAWKPLGRRQIATNTKLASLRLKCRCGRRHQQLRGYSSYHRCSWTHVAEFNLTLVACQDFSAGLFACQLVGAAPNVFVSLVAAEQALIESVKLRIQDLLNIEPYLVDLWKACRCCLLELKLWRLSSLLVFYNGARSSSTRWTWACFLIWFDLPGASFEDLWWYSISAERCSACPTTGICF